MIRAAAILCLLWFNSCKINPPQMVNAKGVPVNYGRAVNLFIFFDLECPVCQRYNGTIDTFFKPGLILDPWIVLTRNDTTGLFHFAKYNGIPFERILCDDQHRLSGYLGATVTPQAVITDRELKKIYSGAIDNRFEELGTYREKAAKNYVLDVLHLLADGRRASFFSTKAVGCDIE
jgi:hypothetical protein